MEPSWTVVDPSWTPRCRRNEAEEAPKKLPKGAAKAIGVKSCISGKSSVFFTQMLDFTCVIVDFFRPFVVSGTSGDLNLMTLKGLGLDFGDCLRYCTIILLKLAPGRADKEYKRRGRSRSPCDMGVGHPSGSSFRS